MKVGQVTFCGNNYGSVLQCYATQQVLKKRNIECVLLTRREKGIRRIMQSVEFRSDMLWKMLRYPKYFSTFCDSLQNLKALHEERSLTTASGAAIDSFIHSRILSKAYSWKDLKRNSRDGDYAFFLSGSDQIWSANWFITNRLWFLRFCPKEKRVAWMPSFGGETLAEYNQPIYTKYICEYAHLSVREEAGRRILEDLLHIQVPVLGDPVFLQTGNEWRGMAKKNIRSKPYILMFFLDRPSDLALKQAQMLQRTVDADVVYFAYDYKDSNAELLEGGPESFLGLVDEAAVVLTDSFHACAFSVIMHTPFYAFARNSQSGAKQMSRIQNLMETFSLESHYITDEENLVHKLQSFSEKQVDDKLTQIREGILEYLDMLLHNYTLIGE